MNLIARYLDYLLKQFGPTAIFGKLQWTKIQNQEKVLALIFFFFPSFLESSEMDLFGVHNPDRSLARLGHVR